MLRKVKLTKKWAGQKAGKVLEVDPLRQAKLLELELAESLDLDEIKGLPDGAREALEVAGLTTFEDLAGREDDELLELDGFGPKSLRIVRTGLEGRV